MVKDFPFNMEGWRLLTPEQKAHAREVIDTYFAKAPDPKELVQAAGVRVIVKRAMRIEMKRCGFPISVRWIEEDELFKWAREHPELVQRQACRWRQEAMLKWGLGSYDFDRARDQFERTMKLIDR